MESYAALSVVPALVESSWAPHAVPVPVEHCAVPRVALAVAVSTEARSEVLAREQACCAVHWPVESLWAYPRSTEVSAHRKSVSGLFLLKESDASCSNLPAPGSFCRYAAPVAVEFEVSLEADFPQKETYASPHDPQANLRGAPVNQPATEAYSCQRLSWAQQVRSAGLFFLLS